MWGKEALAPQSLLSPSINKGLGLGTLPEVLVQGVFHPHCSAWPFKAMWQRAGAMERCVIQPWLMSTSFFCSFPLAVASLGFLLTSNSPRFSEFGLFCTVSAISCQLLCCINLEPTTFPNVLCAVEQVLLVNARPDVEKRRAPVWASGSHCWATNPSQLKICNLSA